MRYPSEDRSRAESSGVRYVTELLHFSRERRTLRGALHAPVRRPDRAGLAGPDRPRVRCTLACPACRRRGRSLRARATPRARLDAAGRATVGRADRVVRRGRPHASGARPPPDRRRAGHALHAGLDPCTGAPRGRRCERTRRPGRPDSAPHRRAARRTRAAAPARSRRTSRRRGPASRGTSASCASRVSCAHGPRASSGSTRSTRARSRISTRGSTTTAVLGEPAGRTRHRTQTTKEERLMQSIIPYLLYKDCDAALDWLARAFGFEEVLRYTRRGRLRQPCRDEARRRAHLHGRPRRGLPEPEGARAGHRRPLRLRRRRRPALRARQAAGAEIIRPPEDQEYGDRRYDVDRSRGPSLVLRLADPRGRRPRNGALPCPDGPGAARTRPSPTSRRTARARSGSGRRAARPATTR